MFIAFVCNTEQKLPENMSREEIIKLVNDSVTDEQLQAHALMAMKEQLGLTFDAKLNPNMPEPKYLGSTL